MLNGQTIIAKYYPATNFKPSRIIAWASGNPKKRFTEGYHNHGSEVKAYHAAAERVVVHWGFPPIDRWVGGWIDNNTAVFVQRG